MADKCHSEATCSNTIGGYNCQCNPGFTGNGTHCQGKLLYVAPASIFFLGGEEKISGE